MTQLTFGQYDLHHITEIHKFSNQDWVGRMCRNLKENGYSLHNPLDFLFMNNEGTPIHCDTSFHFSISLLFRFCALTAAPTELDIRSLYEGLYTATGTLPLIEFSCYSDLSTTGAPYIRPSLCLKTENSCLLDSWAAASPSSRYKVRKSLKQAASAGMYIRELDTFSKETLLSWVPECYRKFGDTYTLDSMNVVQSLKGSVPVHTLGLYSGTHELLAVSTFTYSEVFKGFNGAGVYEISGNGLWQYQNYFEVAHEAKVAKILLLKALEWLSERYESTTIDMMTHYTYGSEDSMYNTYKKELSNFKKDVSLYTYSGDDDLHPPYTKVNADFSLSNFKEVVNV